MKLKKEVEEGKFHNRKKLSLPFPYIVALQIENLCCLNFKLLYLLSQADVCPVVCGCFRPHRLSCSRVTISLGAPAVLLLSLVILSSLVRDKETRNLYAVMQQNNFFIEKVSNWEYEEFITCYYSHDIPERHDSYCLNFCVLSVPKGRLLNSLPLPLLICHDPSALSCCI